MNGQNETESEGAADATETTGGRRNTRDRKFWQNKFKRKTAMGRRNPRPRRRFRMTTGFGGLRIEEIQNKPNWDNSMNFKRLPAKAVKPARQD
jgi:hypothetical protein